MHNFKKNFYYSLQSKFSALKLLSNLTLLNVWRCRTIRNFFRMLKFGQYWCSLIPQIIFLILQFVTYTYMYLYICIDETGQFLSSTMSHFDVLWLCYLDTIGTNTQEKFQNNFHSQLRQPSSANTNLYCFIISCSKAQVLL